MQRMAATVSLPVRQLTSNDLVNHRQPGGEPTQPPPPAQPELALRREPSRAAVPAELVRSRRTQGAAFSLACDASGLEDKELYLAMGVDAGTWSRMRDGKNTLSGDRVAEFCALVGNTIYPEWLAYQIGCVLVVIKSEAERRAEAAEARAAAAELENRLLRELVQGRASP